MRVKKLKLSKGTHFAKIKWDADKHKRDKITGRFLNKPGSDEFKAEPFGPGKTSNIKQTDVIKLHVTTNPKKPGSKAASDFDKYSDDMTVAEFKAAVGSNIKANEHIAHDLKKGFITVHDPATLPVKPPPPPKLGLSDYAITGKTKGVQPTDKIKVLASSNPKKPGSKAAEDFAKYSDEMTVAEFHAAVGSKTKAQEHLLHDMKKGFISIHNPADLGALKSGVKSTGQLAAEMKVGDKALGVVTANPFTAGTKNHADFETTAKQLGLTTSATVAAPKPPKLADLDDNDIIVSNYGTEYNVKAFKKYNDPSGTTWKSTDAKLASGEWTVKGLPEPPAPVQPKPVPGAQPQPAAAPGGVSPSKTGLPTSEPVQTAPPKVLPKQDLEDTAVIKTGAGVEYTVAEYKAKWKSNGYDDAEVIEKVNAGLKHGTITVVKKAGGLADDDVIETFTGNHYTVAEYSKKHGVPTSYIQGKVDQGTFKVVPKKPAPVTQIEDTDIIQSSTGNQYGAVEYKSLTGISDQQLVNLVNGGKVKLIKPAAKQPAPTAAPAPAPAAAPTQTAQLTKVTDIPEAEYSTHDLMLTTTVNPYPHASPTWIKFQSFTIGSASSTKSMSMQKYMNTKALTPDEKKVALQQLIDDGHVKIVTPAQKKAVQAQKDKLAQEAAEQAAQAVKNQYKAHYEQVKTVKPHEWYSDPKWGSNVPGHMMPGDVNYSSMNATLKASGLKYNSADHDESVSWYTDGGYSKANEKLRSVSQGFSTLDSTQKHHVKRLDTITSSTVANDIVMWRGNKPPIGDFATGDTIKNLNNIPPPLEWVDGGITSTSFNPKVSLNFSGRSTVGGGTPGVSGSGKRTLFKVRIPKGTKAAFVGRWGSAYEGMNDEAEVIIARGTRYRYVSTTRNVDFNGSNVDIIEIEVVNHEGFNF